MSIDFAREAESFEEAVRSAIGHMQAVGLTAARGGRGGGIGAGTLTKTRLSVIMPRPLGSTIATTYGARVAGRLRELRLQREWSVDHVRARLAKLGARVSVQTVYAYERGKAGGGVDLPLELVPIIARLYECEHPGDWLPNA
jgi:hypothetical protein